MTTKPKFIYRFLKVLVNFLIVVLFSLLVDGLIVTKIAFAIPSNKQIQDDYNALRIEYEKKEDEYGLYTYDETGKRIKVDGADDTAFKADPRVQEIIVLGRQCQIKLKNINLVSIICSYVISALIIYLIPPIFSKKHYDLGSRAFSIVVSKDDELVNKKEYYKFILVYMAFHLLIGVITLFIFNLIDFLFAVFSNSKKSLIERMMKCELAIDFDKIEANMSTDEKLYENEHSHSDETPREIFKL